MTDVAFLALGANLGEPEAQIAEALERLDAGGARVEQRARLYRSAPVGPPGQPDYVNTAARVSTALSPLELLDLAKKVEKAIGRTRGVRWGPRVIDVDLALYGDRVMRHPRLVLPHRELAHRRFVLAPLADLDPELEVPGLGKIATLLARLGDRPDDLSVLEDRRPTRAELFGARAEVDSAPGAPEHP